MPEGPELLLSCEKINSLIKGKKIINSVISPNSRFAKFKIQNYNPCNFTPIVKDIKVKGKLMYWEFDNGQYMLNTYGMTGQWSEERDKHTAFTFYYLSSDKQVDDVTNCNYLYFNDPRHFGTIKFLNSKDDLIKKLNSLGWCPLSENLDIKFNFIKSKLNNKSIGELLLNQSVFAGVGNYIRAEALYRSKLNPWKISKSLTDNELKELCANIVDVMKESFSLQGASFSTYTNVDKENGKYSHFFQVYSKDLDPHGYKIIKESMGTRTIHWCPDVQKNV